MAGNLTALVQHLCALSDGPVARVHQAGGYDHDGATDYLKALARAWAGDWGGAVDQASAALAADPEQAERFQLYRLWIAGLAETRALPDLHALGKHLFLRGQASPEDQQTFAALRGIAHLELDEMGAARLLARAFEPIDGNPYGLELVQLTAARGDTTGEVPALCRTIAPLNDYFQWQTLARTLLVAREEEALNGVLGFIRDHFRGSVLPLLFEFHRCVDSGFYAAAAMVAQRLSELHPENVDYRYYQAYARFEDGDYPSARQILSETLNLTGEQDAEVCGLLGHCHAKLGNPEKAAHYLRRAASLLKEEGLPTSQISLELANVEDELRGDKIDPALEMPRMTRKWLVNLSPRRYHEFVTSSESSIDRLLRPMGKEPAPGDICFFATTSRQGKGNQWKIVGIYAVDSVPIWHPTRRYHSALKLISRLPVGIPVDVETQEDDGLVAADVAKDAPSRFGVFELDNSAIDIIEEAVRLNRDEMIERRRSDSSRRPTA